MKMQIQNGKLRFTICLGNYYLPKKNSNKTKESISILEKGFYFFKIQKGDYLQVEKVVVLGF